MTYGLLRVDRSGKISQALIVDVADDRSALARGSDFASDDAVEVWCSGRQSQTNLAALHY